MDLDEPSDLLLVERLGQVVRQEAKLHNEGEGELEPHDSVPHLDRLTIQHLHPGAGALGDDLVDVELPLLVLHLSVGHTVLGRDEDLLAVIALAELVLVHGSGSGAWFSSRLNAAAFSRAASRSSSVHGSA